MDTHAIAPAPSRGRVARGAVVGASAALLLLSTLMVGIAAADTLACGTVITTDTRLTADIGPCTGPGLIVVADGVTLDLAGHTVFGDPFARADAGDERGNDTPGIVLRRVSGVTLANGTVTGFDAGVAVMGGGGNTVRNVTSRDNINYRVVTGIDADPNAPGTPRPDPCVFGDGIAVFNSTNNQIIHNVVANNGPLSGIALVENSDDNLVAHNRVLDNDVTNRTRDGNPRNTICGTNSDQGPMTAGRAVQDIGIRVEGPGADRNRVELNTVARSALTGIALHGWVCNSPNERVPVVGNNGDNVIARNTVTETGLRTHEIDSHAHGIAAMQQGPASIVCVAHSNTIVGNNSSQNFADGIFLGGRGTHDNTISDNVVQHNARDGIRVTGPATMRDGSVVPGAVNNTITGNRGHRNGGFDGADYNAECDNNDWRANRFGTVNQACVAAGGTGWVGGPGKSADAPGQENAGGPLGRRA